MVASSRANDLRIYLTDGTKYWRIFTVWIQPQKEGGSPDGSFYFSVPSKLEPFVQGHFSYHPDGTTHFKNEQKAAKYRKFNWPNFTDLTIAALDSFGFMTDGPMKAEPFFQERMSHSVKNPSLIFDVAAITGKMIIPRLYFGKTAMVDDRPSLSRLVTPSPPGNAETPNERLVDLQVHRFGQVNTELGTFDFSLAAALISSDRP